MKAHGKQKRMRIYFTGVGGQGTLTATTLLARTALQAGLHVVAGEVHGMAQRGGVVESVLLLGGWRSPKLDFGEADLLLGFEPLETLRGLPYLRPGGAVFSSRDPLPPVSVSLGQVSYPDMAHIEEQTRMVAGQCRFIPCRELGGQAGSVQSGNTVLLSAVCASGVLPFGVDALEAAIKKYLPAKLHKSNLKALELGKKVAA
ncbi:indolepyruvate oxidoreductase subunit beta [uncultured Desulfovibrio sp.]|uniref:indolepyruvate oxidoreductase subunit beta n=1 Tax=uncultured Desulfovibrio sp. TaxID=167968 RepID=UPI0003A860F1|nr:indolepyruvate oxidoreductase subunit beta [uncultured Desulfovibrio sp.]